MLDFGRRKRRYKAAVAAYDEARLDYEQAVMAAFGDVSTAATNMRKAAETVELRRDHYLALTVLYKALGGGWQ